MKLGEWLEDKPQEWGIWIAHRAAMRIWPLGWPWFRSDKARKLDLTDFPSLRCFLISGVAAVRPTPDIKVAADDAARAADAAAAAVDAAAARAVFAAFAAAADAADAAARAAAAAARAAAFAADAADADDVAHLWDMVQRDCTTLAEEGVLPIAPLWADQRGPFHDAWGSLKHTLPQSPAGQRDETARAPKPEDWSFWIRWYDAALEGRPLNLDMLEEIALIPPETWDKGPGVVNPLIADIEAKYARLGSYNAERIILNDDDEFEAVPELELPPDVFAIAKDRVRDAVAEFKALPEGDNLKGACDRDIARIEDYLDRHADTPLRIYEVLMRTIRHIDEKVKEGDLPEREDLNDFREELDNSALDILQGDEKVRTAVRNRSSGRFDRLSEIEKEHYLSLMELLAKQSEPKTADEMRDDARVATDPDAEEDDRREARFRSGSRALRMKELKEGTVKGAEDIAKVGRGADAVGNIWDMIVGWFI
ncbi:hypothetical protein [Oceanicola sp. D3]|uniref:hypothetical protein n=1 Tax=Oceanicola sp. D3 TaxID=2587163 RepID=UPI00143DEBF7|nr:hypothetical protein [Oceanicola sp. D3]